MQVKTYKFFDLSFALKETQEKLYLAFVFVAFLGLALGPSPRAIGMAGSAILALGFPHLFKKIQSMFCEPWFYASLLIVFIAACGLLYSPATTDEKRIIFTKYAKVGYLPILYLAFHHPKAKQVAIHGFLMGMFLTAIISTLKFYQLIESSIPDVGFVFYNHIITSYFMSFAIYLCLYQIKMGPRNLQWFYMGLAAVLGFQLFFINTGRTGIISFLILVMIWLFQFYSIRKMLIPFLSLFFIFIVSNQVSATFNQKILSIRQEVVEIAHQKRDNSLGFRVQFHRYAKNLWLMHPLLGNGTASFKALFRTENPMPQYGDTNLSEPHNVYWLFACELGLVGLCILFYFIATITQKVMQDRSLKKLNMALLGSFLIMNLNDSLLFHSAPGFFFLFFISLSLAFNGEHSNAK